LSPPGLEQFPVVHLLSQQLVPLPVWPLVRLPVRLLAHLQ